jgi:hypothetical protein
MQKAAFWAKNKDIFFLPLTGVRLIHCWSIEWTFTAPKWSMYKLHQFLQNE